MSSTGNTAILHTELDKNISGRVVVVRAIWNEVITSELHNGVLRVLSDYKNLEVQEFMVPGVVEIPFAIATCAKKFLPMAFIALGCVIKGDTPHFDYVCQSVTQGITQLNLTLSVPTIYGILTVHNQQQALDRIGGVHGHKGEEAALTALHMIRLHQHLHQSNT